MITRRIRKIMALNVLCPKCGHRWSYSGCAIKATCPSCYGKVQVRALPDPGPRIVPAHFKAAPKSVLHTPKALEERKTLERVKGKIRRHQQGLDKLQDGQTIQGKTQTQATGRVQVQSFSVPASKPIPVKHPRSAFTPEEQCAGHVCHHCHREIKYPKMGFWVDGTCMHRPCLVDEAIQQSGGDLQRASYDWDIPIEALQKRAAVLKEKGKLNFNSIIA
jgi:hypothetical protein